MNKNKNFKLCMSHGPDIVMDEKDLETFVTAFTSGSGAALNQALVNPVYFVSVVPTEDGPDIENVFGKYKFKERVSEEKIPF